MGTCFSGIASFCPLGIFRPATSRALQVYDPDGRLLLQVAAECDIAFILVRFLRKLHKEDKILPRRQDLPDGSFVSGAKDLVAKYLPKVEVNFRGMRTIKKARRQLWVISHGWLTAEHPDPAGRRLKDLLEKLDSLQAREDDIVFFDFSSLSQIDKLHVDYRHGEMLPDGHPALRSPEESRTFGIAMCSMDRLYASSASRVIVMRTIYDSSGIPLHPGGTSFTVNNRQYDERGWCVIELTLSNNYGRIANVKDLPRMMPLENVDPDGFKAAIKDGRVGFTCSGDEDAVQEMFKRYFAAGRIDLLVKMVSEGKAEDILDGIQCALRSMDPEVCRKMVKELVKHEGVRDYFYQDLLECFRKELDEDILLAIGSVIRPDDAITILGERKGRLLRRATRR